MQPTLIHTKEKEKNLKEEEEEETEEEEEEENKEEESTMTVVVIFTQPELLFTYAENCQLGCLRGITEPKECRNINLKEPKTV